MELYSSNKALPPHFGEAIASLFVMQREYINRVAAKATS